MARKARVRWSEVAGAWRSDVGPRNEAGRRTAVHFRTRTLSGGEVEELPNTPAGERKAATLLEEYLRERDRREAQAEVDKHDPELHEVVEMYLEHVLATKKPKTAQAYRERLDVVMQYQAGGQERLGYRRVGTLTIGDGAKMVKVWKDKGYSPNYITNGLLLTVKACLNWAATVDHAREPTQIIKVNPWAQVKGPEAGLSERDLVSRDELAAYLSLAWMQANAWKPDANRRCSGCRRADRKIERRCQRTHAPRQTLARTTVLLVRCQYHCGTRPGELCLATWSGWNPQADRDPATGQWWGLITIWGKNTERKKAMRQIPVRPILARAIERIRAISYHHPEFIFGHLAKEGKQEQSAWPPKVVGWKNSSELARRIRLWRIEGIMLAAESERTRLIKAGLAPDQAAAQVLKMPSPYNVGITLYTLRHTFYTDAIEGGETFERAGAVGDTGAATIEKTYFRHRMRSRFETARRIAKDRKIEG